jgi:tetratricopeptide (TPR) repeat protein
MKRNFLLWLGVLAFALLPVFAQTPKATGKIHGHVTDPTGVTRTDGTVSLTIGDSHNYKFTFPLSSTGDYAGEATPGTYTVIFRAPDTPPGLIVDSIENVKIVAGQDVHQDVDMSRKAYVDKLPAEQQKQLEELRKRNAEALKSNAIIKSINADIITSNQDFKDADAARQTAKQALGASASREELDAKENEIKTAKFSEIETLMLKDTTARADVSALWAQLGQAQLGLARIKGDTSKYDEAEASYKKALEVEATAKKPNLQNQGAAHSGLGEIYARTGKVPEANAAYEEAAKINPAGAATYLTNEAALFVNAGNGDAAAAAADEAIKADPKLPLPYYLKGQGLIQKATVEPKTGKMILPEGCAEAYQQYLALAPTGQFVSDVKGILAEAAQVHSSAFGNDTGSKKKKGK